MSASSTPSSPGGQTRKAIVIEAAGDARIADIPVPVMQPTEILVKTTAVSLNGIDQLSVDYYASPGCIVGCEFVGTIIAIGHKVEQELAIGDRVAGLVHGCKIDSSDVLTQLFQDNGGQSKAFAHEHGAFTDIVLAQGDLVYKVPDWMKDEEACVIPIGLVYGGMALYQALGFPMFDTPSRRPTPLLIYGATSNSGAYTIQLAKLSGLRVLVTCSEHNFDYAKSLGADQCFDYHSPTVGEEIHRAAPMLSYVLDCRSTPESKEICSKAICLAGGTYLSTLPFTDFERADVRAKFIGTFACFGEAFTLGPAAVPASKQQLEWTKAFLKKAWPLVTEKKIQPLRQDVREGGLHGALKGIEAARKGPTTSGSKIVWKI